MKQPLKKLRQQQLTDLEQKIRSFEQQELKIEKNDNKIVRIATELIVTMVIGFFIGHFLDKLFASRPIFMLICSLLAMIAAFRSLYYANFK